MLTQLEVLVLSIIVYIMCLIAYNRGIKAGRKPVERVLMAYVAITERELNELRDKTKGEIK